MTVTLGSKSFQFRALSFREAKAFRAKLAAVKGLSDDESGEALIAAMAPHCTSHTAEQLAGLREAEIANLPYLFDRERRIKERELGESWWQEPRAPERVAEPAVKGA